MSKKVLIIHGWPQPVAKENILYQYFTDKGYEIVSPYLFDLEASFNLENAVNEIKRNLKNEEPEIIAGFSLGGLLIPYLAKEFHNAKLIFIATGTCFSPTSKLFRQLLFAIDKTGFLLLKIIYFLPQKLLRLLYETINLSLCKDDLLKKYESYMKANFQYSRKIPMKRQLEIIRFAKCTNSTPLLSEIKNKSIIFSSVNDFWIPISEGEKLKAMLKNSKLIITQGTHFNVFTKENFADIDNFLSK